MDSISTGCHFAPGILSIGLLQYRLVNSAFRSVSLGAFPLEAATPPDCVQGKLECGHSRFEDRHRC